MNNRVVIACLASTVLCGCPLPIPHDRALSPIFYGTVLDADTQVPVFGVSVVVKGDFRDAEAKTKSDTEGKYEIGVTERATFYVILPAPAEGICSGTATFSHKNYETKTVKESWFGSASFDGPCSRIKRDIWLKKLPSNYSTQPTAGSGG